MNDEIKQDVNVENTTSKSLMRKTKVQLVDIILRKDSVEIELNKKVKDLNNIISSQQNDKNKLTEDLNNAIENYKNLFKHNTSLKSDYEETCDILISERVSNKIKINKLNLYCYLFGILDIVLLICLILF